MLQMHDLKLSKKTRGREAVNERDKEKSRIVIDEAE